jgi:hypothetical protein
VNPFWIFDFRFWIGEIRLSRNVSPKFLRIRSDNLEPKIQNLKWAGIFAFLVVLTVCAARAEAQQPAKIARIGYLGSGSASSAAAHLLAFRQKLRDLAYTEEKQIVIEGRYSEGKTERLPQFAGDLVRLPVDVIVTGENEAVQAAKKITQSLWRLAEIL